MQLFEILFYICKAGKILKEKNSLFGGKRQLSYAFLDNKVVENSSLVRL